jgi:hypothetical protein
VGGGGGGGEGLQTTGGQGALIMCLNMSCFKWLNSLGRWQGGSSRGLVRGLGQEQDTEQMLEAMGAWCWCYSGSTAVATSQ